jgi:hypothetical protein
MDKTIKIPKKQWHQPELVVLVRGTPEEAVLVYCKAGPLDGGTGGSNANLGPGCGVNLCRDSCFDNKKS